MSKPLTDERNGRPYQAAGEKRVIIWTVVFAAVMAALTFLDLPIAKSVYHYSDLYGRIFQIVGIIPTCISGTFFAVSNLCTRKIARKRILSAAVSVLAILLFMEKISSMPCSFRLSRRRRITVSNCFCIGRS